MAIQDFGEKIGGAKKDLWKARGLSIEDLLDMNEAEKTTYIKKDNVWQKPNYQELVDGGIPVRVVYFMKKIRDATPTKPVLAYSDNSAERITVKQEGYVSFVRDLRDAVMSLKTEADVLGFYENYLAKRYITREPGRYYVTVSDEAFGCIDNKLLKAAQLSSFGAIDRDIKKKQFCYTEKDKQQAEEKAFKDQFEINEFNSERVLFGTDYSGRTQITIKLPMGLGSYFVYPQGEDADPATWEEGKYFVFKRGRVVAKNLESREAAKSFVDNLFKESRENQAEVPAPQTHKRKTRFTPKQLQHIQRLGEDYRHGVPATGKKYMEVFRFKGGEFGNWMSENDRRASLDYGYDALIDMCKAINISTKDISLGGRLSIAFGARGSAGAAAHYEPLREVINLTKMHGAGSLAHEWAHALDDILGKALGVSKFMTENTRSAAIPQALKNLVESMRYKTVQNEDILVAQQKEVERYKKNLEHTIRSLFPVNHMSEKQLDKLQNLSDVYINNAKDCHERFLACVVDGSGNGNVDIDALSVFRKEVCGHGLAKDQRISLAHYQNNLRSKLERVGTSERVKTDFYENSICFDSLHSKSDHGYWQSTVEMFARAFACYVHDKIEGKSDYLVGHSEAACSLFYDQKTGKTKEIKAIPVGDERCTINQCFDDLIQALKEKELLHDFDPGAITVSEKKPSLMEQIRNSQIKYDAAVKENNVGQLEFEF